MRMPLEAGRLRGRVARRARSAASRPTRTAGPPRPRRRAVSPGTGSRRPARILRIGRVDDLEAVVVAGEDAACPRTPRSELRYVSSRLRARHAAEHLHVLGLALRARRVPARMVGPEQPLHSGLAALDLMRAGRRGQRERRYDHRRQTACESHDVSPSRDENDPCGRLSTPSAGTHHRGATPLTPGRTPLTSYLGGAAPNFSMPITGPHARARVPGRRTPSHHVVAEFVAERGHDHALVEREVEVRGAPGVDVHAVAETPAAVHLGELRQPAQVRPHVGFAYGRARNAACGVTTPFV